MQRGHSSVCPIGKRRELRGCKVRFVHSLERSMFLRKPRIFKRHSEAMDRCKSEGRRRSDSACPQ